MRERWDNGVLVLELRGIKGKNDGWLAISLGNDDSIT
jgi:hypothetical protein